MIAVARRRWTSRQIVAAVALTALCCGLAALLAIELDDAPIDSPALPHTAEPAAAGGDGAPSAPEFALRPLQDYSAVITRPLFSPTRRPPLETERIVAGADDFVLAGVVATATDRTALIRHGLPPKIERLTEGQTTVGWTVRSILPDRVVIENGGTLRELKLREKSSRKVAGG